MRDLELNPEQHLHAEAGSDVAALVAQERRLLAEQPAFRGADSTRTLRRKQRLQRYEHFTRLRDVKRKLAEFTVPERSRIAEERDTVLRQLQANQVLTDREFSFCLYSEDKLRRFMSRIGT